MRAYSHGTLSVDTPGGRYAGAVDVATPSGIKVHYRLICRLICRLNHLALTPLLGLPAGWQPLVSTSSSSALDYVHSPTIAARPTSRYSDFLLFRRESVIGRFLRWLESLRNSWVDSNSDNALNALETQLLGSVRIFVFGAPASSELSVHDIHLNQGDPLGPFQHLDGIWQDGGGLIERPSGGIVAFLTEFATQSLHTNSERLPIGSPDKQPRAPSAHTPRTRLSQPRYSALLRPHWVCKQNWLQRFWSRSSPHGGALTRDLSILYFSSSSVTAK